MDADGKPVSGGVEPHVIREAGEWPPEIVLLPISIDKNGRFRIDNLVPGATYTFTPGTEWPSASPPAARWSRRDSNRLSWPAT